MRKIFVIILLLVIQPLAHANVTEDYKYRLSSDASTAEVLQRQMKNKSRAGCTEITEKDMSSCFKAQLKSISITSSVQVTGFAEVGNEAALKDRESGAYTPAMIALMQINNQLSVLDRINISAFHVNQMSIANVNEYFEIVALRKNEDQLLQRTIYSVMTDLNKKFAQIELLPPEKRLPTAAEKKWYDQSFAITRDRLSKYDSGKHRFPASLTLIRKEEIAKYLAKEKRNELCSKVAMCSRFTPKQCTALNDRVFISCALNTLPTKPLVAKPDLQAYVSELLKCSAKNWEPTFYKAVPSCK